MTDLFLLVLAGAWAVIFLPRVLWEHRNAPIATARRFRSRMALIAPRRGASGRWVLVVSSSGARERRTRRSLQKTLRHRRRLVAVMAIAVPLSLAAALSAGGLVWGVQVTCDAALIGYTVLLLEWKRQREAGDDKVASLASRRSRTAGARPDLARRRA